jgi:protein tyrosine/serine phosphatase
MIGMKGGQRSVRPHMKKLILLLVLISGTCYAAETAPRPAKWATKIELPDVQNLYKVTDNLYRSQQPSEAGFKALKEHLGIKTVINLRAFHSDKEKLSGLGVLNKELSVKTWHIEDEDVIKVLSILRKKENGPFLIHCQHGADRTGVMSAMYRIVEQGWTKDDAIAEMVNGGYGFHALWSNIIQYIKQTDVKKIRDAVK